MSYLKIDFLLGLQRVGLFRVSGRVGFECSGNGSGRVFHIGSFRVSGFMLRVSGNHSGNELVL